jgi:hypothetical protein
MNFAVVESKHIVYIIHIYLIGLFSSLFSFVIISHILCFCVGLLDIE